MASAGVQDCLGNSISAAEAPTLAAIDDFVGGFLGYEERAVNVLQAAEADARCCLANVYAGMIWMFLEAPEAPARAARFIARAEAAAPAANPREQGALAHLKAWSANDIDGALAIVRELIDSYPRDLAIAKLGQYHCFNRGDAAGMLALAERVAPGTEDVAWSHGMRAFALEQCHRLAEAEDAARRAIAMKRKEPWAHHALAHVMLTQGRLAEGAQFMTAMSPTWQGLNSFMYTHNWWHLALFGLALGEREPLLALYDRHVWGIAKDYSQDQIGAVSLLARFELEGLDVGPRWQSLAPYLAPRAEDTVQPFLSLHYLYGLARAGQPEARILRAAIARAGKEAPLHCRAAWSDVALPAADALLAFAAGEHARAADGLQRVLPRLHEIGGSHAQRDLFEQIHLAALIGAGRLGEAQQALERRRHSDPANVPQNRRLASVYDRLGLRRPSDLANI